MMCENPDCNRETDYLFKGAVTSKATRYEKRGAHIKRLGVVKQTREAMVCFRCRPASNLEKREILDAAKGRRIIQPA